MALIGDAEMDEGNIFEALLEGWKHGLRNTWWIVDYNRQSLDAVIREGLWERLEGIFRNFGWEVVILKHGQLHAGGLSEEPGGEALRTWIDTCPNQLYSALTFQGGAAWRKRLLDELGDQGPVSPADRAPIRRGAGAPDGQPGRPRSTVPAGRRSSARKHDRPALLHRLYDQGFRPAAAGPRQPSGLLFRHRWMRSRNNQNIRPGPRMGPLRRLSVGEQAVRGFLNTRAVLSAKAAADTPPPAVPVPEALTGANAEDAVHPSRLRPDHERAGAVPAIGLAERIVTTAPDVTVSTNLGSWVNRRGLFAQERRWPTCSRRSAFRPLIAGSSRPRDSISSWASPRPTCSPCCRRWGCRIPIFGERLLPIGTVYDPFIYRGADALNYACYQDARFMLVATPAGVTLAPEGGAHQSIGTPLVGMAQDGLAYFEPAFVDELGVIMRWAFDYMQRDGEGPAERAELAAG